MALINKPNYSLLQNSLKIDEIIDPRMNMYSILKHIPKYNWKRTQLWMVNIGYWSWNYRNNQLINKELKNSNCWNQMSAVLRENKVIIPRSILFQKRIKVIAQLKRSISVVENIFGWFYLIKCHYFELNI